MGENNLINNVIENIQKAMGLPKCRQCGCMIETLENMRNELSKTKNNGSSELLNEVESSIEKMETMKYT